MSVYWQELADQLDEENQVGSERISIWGGECAEHEAQHLVDSWPTLKEMPNRIWEYTSEICFEQGSVPDSFEWVERGRLFGTGGDLSLRRDGDRYLWRYVGPTGVTPLPGFDQTEGKFWSQEPDARFYETDESHILWGERRAEGDEQWWFDDRVARADLSYPVQGTPGRVKICYKTYSRAGRVEFVWLQGLDEKEP